VGEPFPKSLQAVKFECSVFFSEGAFTHTAFEHAWGDVLDLDPSHQVLSRDEGFDLVCAQWYIAADAVFSNLMLDVYSNRKLI